MRRWCGWELGAAMVGLGVGSVYFLMSTDAGCTRRTGVRQADMEADGQQGAAEVAADGQQGAAGIEHDSEKQGKPGSCGRR